MQEATSIIYQDQSAEGLHLYLLDQAADVRPLHILVQSSIKYQEVELEYGILGASHYALWKTRSGLLMELFACLSSFDAPGLLRATPIRELPREVHHSIAGGGRYSFAAFRLGWGDGRQQWTEWQKELPILQTRRFDFPGAAGAETQTLLVSMPNGISLRSLHAYPGQQTVVLTKSKLLF